MRTTDAAILGIVQGLTEFLPVSSTAHLYLVQALLGIPNDALTLSFDVVLHLGTVLALLLATADSVFPIVRELLLWIARRPARDTAARGLLLPLAVGTLPGVLAGLFLLKRFEELRTLGLIGISMIVAAVYFFVAEWQGQRGPQRSLARVTTADGAWMGVAQAAAGLMAGLSRSGLTISTGRFRGLSREDSARFSFLLAIPIISGAGAKSLLDLSRHPHASIGRAALAAGFCAAALVGYLAVRFLLRFLRTHTLRPFGVYLGFLGLALLLFSFSRGLPILAQPGAR